MEIKYGYCCCGCGQKTNLALKTYGRLNIVKGQPHKFIRGHQHKNKTGKLSSNWKGGRIVNREYNRVLIQAPNNSRAMIHGYVYEHILVAEKVLGKPFPVGAVVHHIDGNASNNEHSNLVICENNAYHLILHRKKRSLEASGHANWRKCWICKQYDAPDKLYIKARACYHRTCQTAYSQKPGI